MNKKFLSAILFGALMVTSTGTFVSCKDYDDDIKDLQGQIDKLATKEDMTSQIAALQAALTTAQSDATAAKTSAEKALATATEAEKAAAQAALDVASAKVEAIKAAQDEVAKVKAELEATIDSKFAAAKAEFAETITDLTNKVKELTGLTTDMITSLDLQGGDLLDFELDLNYYQIAADYNSKKVYTFGKNLAGSFDVTPGEIFANPDSFLVSVAPVNAVLPDNILSIVDSEGTSINDYINLKATSYTGKLYARSAANGLYSITAELKNDADKKAFSKLLDNGKTGDNKKSVAFALAASNKDRTVTSTYDLTVSSKATAVTAAEEIADKSTIKSSIEEESALKTWANSSATATPNNEKCYPIVKGEAFQIKVASKVADGVSKVMASYVVVDIENKALSTTDKAAINSLTFGGDINAVSRNNMFNITVDGTYAKGVVIPLKVVTIDYTGKVEENIVWVKAGNGSEVAQTVPYTITPKEYVAAPTTYNYVGIQKFTVPAGYNSYKLSIVDKDDNININGDLLSFFEDAKATKPSTNPAKIAYAKLSATVNLQALKDGKVYEGAVKFYDAEGTFLSQSVITVQKVLPDAFPESFSAKTNAINNGVLTVYPQPEIGAKTGEFAFSKAFNGLVDHIEFKSTDVNLIGDKDHAANATLDNTATNNAINTINPKIINDGKTYGAYVTYNYGDIRSEYEVNGEKSNNHSINWGTTFSIKFGCMIVDSKYSWVSEPVVYYNEDAVIGGKVTSTSGTSSTTKYYDVISVKDVYNAAMDPFTDAVNWNIWAEPISASTKVTLQTTNEAGKVIDNEFYTAAFEKATDGDYKDKWTLKLTKKSTEVVLKDDVKTNVIITITDKFGHEHDVPALSFTMKKSH